MKKENFCNIGYSRKLAKYFGDAEWWWITYHSSGNTILENYKFEDVEIDVNFFIDYKKYKNNECIPAITTDMLLSKMPEVLVRKQNDGYNVNNIFGDHPKWKRFFSARPSNALALLMIWLDENGFLKPGLYE